jgi:hypothetical protein
MCREHGIADCEVCKPVPIPQCARCVSLPIPGAGKLVPYIPHPSMQGPFYCSQRCYNKHYWAPLALKKL